MSWFNNLTQFEQEKLNADPFYSSMIKWGCSYRDLLESGWLNHKYSLDELNLKMNETVTQFNKEKVFILLNTGSYAPAHEGHIAQLKVARSWVNENYPEFTAKMILSPSHDKYTLTKSEDIKPWNINARVDRLYKLIKEDQELNNENFGLDLWESCVCEYPVNFTDVMIKFMKDLENLSLDYKIGYVFGSDLEDFVNPFEKIEDKLKEKVFAFCVNRDGYLTKLNKVSSNIIYLNSDEKYSSLASRKIRNEVKVINKAFYTINEEHSFYGVRRDNPLALKSWINQYPEHSCLINEAYDEFLTNLIGTFEKYTKIKTIPIDLKIQEEIVKELNDVEDIVNLDVGTNHLTKYRLDYSRSFIPGSDQQYTLIMKKRPEVDEIKEIPPGIYAFMDDDIASGRTFENISNEMAKKGVFFNKQYNLMKMYCERVGLEYNLFDIVDGKDFLWGAYSGGLLCDFGDMVTRVPYFMAFVNLYTRASIKPSQWLDFQKDIDLLNKIFFQKCFFIKANDIDINLIKVMKKHRQFKTLSYIES